MRKDFNVDLAFQGKEDEHKLELLKFYLMAGILIGILILFGSFIFLAQAEEYTDDQIVNAIYKAEGGSHAKYPYGIRSIKCGTKEGCRQICKRTVRNTWTRYRKTGRQDFEGFLGSLAIRYSPIGARNDPKGLNKNWLKNVKYFLAEGK